MLTPQKLPIVQKAQLLYYGHMKPISKYHALCLSLIVPHGNTDMWMFPVKKYALNYGSSFAFFMFQPMRIKFIFLFLYSFFHLKITLLVHWLFNLLIRQESTCHGCGFRNGLYRIWRGSTPYCTIRKCFFF